MIETLMEADNILDQIHTAGMRFLLPLDLKDTYKVIVDEAVRMVDAEYGSIVLSENSTWNRIYTSSTLANKISNRKNGNTAKAFNENIVIVADIEETGKFHPELKKQGMKSSIFIPLSYEDKAIGVLIINAKKKIEQSANELKALKIYGSMATLVIRKAQLYQETSEALKTRDFFISLASHELRTPLTSINGYIQLLHSRLSNQDTVEAKWVKELYEESKRLTNLIQELLEINRIKQGTLQFILRECNIVEVAEKAVERCKVALPKRKVELVAKTPRATVIGDFDKLLQVFSSILNNAIKFSPDNSVVTFGITKAKGNIVIRITDHGVGIDREDIMKVFDGFYKGDNHLKEGIGVGLMLAKHIIKYHHGTIEIKSTATKGTTVQIILPESEL